MVATTTVMISTAMTIMTAKVATTMGTTTKAMAASVAATGPRKILRLSVTSQ